MVIHDRERDFPGVETGHPDLRRRHRRPVADQPPAAARLSVPAAGDRHPGRRPDPGQPGHYPRRPEVRPGRHPLQRIGGHRRHARPLAPGHRRPGPGGSERPAGAQRDPEPLVRRFRGQPHDHLLRQPHAARAHRKAEAPGLPLRPGGPPFQGPGLPPGRSGGGHRKPARGAHRAGARPSAALRPGTAPVELEPTRPGSGDPGRRAH